MDTNGLTLSDSEFQGCTEAVVVSGSNAHVTDVAVTGGKTGISLMGSDSRVIGCTVTDAEDAISLVGERQRAVSNVLVAGERGIVLDDMDGGMVDMNSLDGFARGIVLKGSHGNSIGSNDIAKADEDHGFYIYEDGAFNDIGRNNTIDGERLRYYFAHSWVTSVTAAYVTVPRLTNIGQVVFVNCTDTLSLQESNITGGDVGLAMINCVGVQVTGTAFIGNRVGVLIDASSDVTLQYVSVWGSEEGIRMVDSRRTTLEANATLARCIEGIHAIDCLATTFSESVLFLENDLGLNGTGLDGLVMDGTSTMRPWFSGNGIGMKLVDSIDIELLELLVSDSATGVALSDCEEVLIEALDLLRCGVGLDASGCTGLVTTLTVPATMRDCDIGFSIEDATEVSLEGIDAFGCDIAIRLKGGSDVSILDVVLASCGVGIQASNTTGILTEGIHANGTGTGIDLVDVDDVMVRNSTTSGGGTFLRITNGTNVEARENEVIDSDVGFETFGSTGVTLAFNDVRTVSLDPLGGPMFGSAGMHIEGSAAITVNDVEIESYRQGIIVSSSIAVTIEDVRLVDTAHRGISAISSTVVISNVMMEGGLVGLHCSDSFVSILDTEISGGEMGIEAVGGRVSALNVTLDGMSDAGASLSACTVDLTDVLVSGSSTGIEALGGTNVTVASSIIADNDIGIVVDDAMVDVVDVELLDNRLSLLQISGTTSVTGSIMRSLLKEVHVSDGSMTLELVQLLGEQEGIDANSADLLLVACTASGMDSLLSADGSTVWVRESTVQCTGTAIEVDDSKLVIEGGHVIGTSAAVVATRSDVELVGALVSDSGVGLELVRSTIVLDGPSFDGNEVGIKAIFSGFVTVEGVSLSNGTLDLSLAHCGLVSATNSSFSTYSFTNTSLAVKNYLRIRVVSQSTGFGMEDADVRIWDDAGTIYATPYFNGSDPRTDRYGYTPFILVSVVNYAPGSVSISSTGVEVRRAEWRVKDLAVDMSRSHTETYRFPYVTFQTISYGKDGAEEAGDGQKGLVGTVLKRPLRVFVENEKNNSVEGIAVVFSVQGPEGLDVLLDPLTAFSGSDGYVHCNVTLPSIAAEFTVTAYLKLDPWKNVTFNVRSQAMEIAIDVGPSPAVLGGERVEIVVRSTPQGQQVLIDFGDGSISGWTEETHHYHTYAPSDTDYIVTAWVMTTTGLVSQPVTESITVTEGTDGPAVERKEDAGTPWFAVAIVIAIVVIVIIAAVTFTVPGIWKKVIPRRGHRAGKEVEFVSAPETFDVVEEPQAKAVNKKVAKMETTRAESLEDLILDLEKHKPGTPAERKTRSRQNVPVARKGKGGNK
ncbi:MAG: right-handed parallel beta-helix repeat-containing protein [Thermoplasmata archaeon]|nr:right-handed parallel beta-helix repeat-containing protein [Thermoplasmata archaeon]